MPAGLDVFKIEADGAAQWQFAVASQHEARIRIRELTAKAPAHYLILNLLTGHRVDVPRTANATSPAGETRT
jgi:hypothetical protein